MAKLDYEKLNATQRYLQYAVFRAIPGALGTERDEVIAGALFVAAECESFS